MALFTNLYHVGEVLGYQLRVKLGLQDDQVIAGPPKDDVLSSKKHLRVTLLWTNEQATHRNDLHERNPDGSRMPAPLSLSAFYLITSHGNTSLQALADAHEVLGDVMRVFHDEPELSLPLSGLNGSGKGKLGINLVTLTPELVEKILGPLQLKHRPFVLYEVGPIQLESLKAMLAARPVVLPNGIRLSGPTLQDKPIVQQIVPWTQGAGGRIRIDGMFPDELTRIRVGSTSIEKNDIQVVDEGRSMSILLPASVKEGTHEVSVTAGEVSSDPARIQVVPATLATLDCPAKMTHSKSTDLVLEGRTLSGVAEMIAWPDAGVRSPSDMVNLPVLAQSSQVTITAAALQALSRKTYRFAARVGANHYTPFIVLEVIP